MEKDINRKINVDIERNRVRIVISHGEDEEIIKLTLDEARDLLEKVQDSLEDYQQRKQIRID
ncbi:MAG: hypothetical protein JXA38_01525 [Methanosarcinaceae archaeon]|nr:hypothetical protein [Methanosarcinaceae archaeon]